MANILCRGCAQYPDCNRKNKNYATKCSGHWEHRPTSDFVEAIEKNWEKSDKKK